MSDRITHVPITAGCVVKYTGNGRQPGRNHQLLTIDEEYLVERVGKHGVQEGMLFVVGNNNKLTTTTVTSVEIVTIAETGFVSDRCNHGLISYKEAQRNEPVYAQMSWSSGFPNDHLPQHASPNDPLPAELMLRVTARIAEFRAFQAG